MRSTKVVDTIVLVAVQNLLTNSTFTDSDIRVVVDNVSLFVTDEREHVLEVAFHKTKVALHRVFKSQGLEPPKGFSVAYSKLWLRRNNLS